MRGLGLILPCACALAWAACRRSHQVPTADPPLPLTAPVAAEPLVLPWVPPPPTRPAAAPSAAPDGGTINGAPRGPRPGEIGAVLDGAHAALQACLDAAQVPPGSYSAQLSYRILPIGTSDQVKATGSASPEALACLQRVVSGLSFPEFEGEPVTGSLPLTYTRGLNPKP